MMKKFISLLICFILCVSNAFAAPHGINAQKTDIKVFLHGKQIPACAINNDMYIAAEDMAEYGYTVTYVNDVRTLFINQTGTPNEITPPPCKVKKALKTDIRIILNGEYIDEDNAFAADGKMYISTNAMTFAFENVGNYVHFLKSAWDADTRTFYIDNAPLLSKEEQIDDFLSYGGNRENYTFLSFEESHFEGDGFEIVGLRIGGLPHGPSYSYRYFTDEGKNYDLRILFNPFKIRDAWGNIEIRNPRLEGRKFYFEGQRTMNNVILSEGVYYGTYYLDLDTMVVNTVTEEKLN